MLIGHYNLNEHEQKLVNMSRKEYTKYMLEKYPNMFGDYHKPMSETCMCWGFDIGNGWYHVLDSLCEKLKEIEKFTGIKARFVQIKEKFGTACFYNYTEAVETQNDSINFKVWYSIIDVLINRYEDYCDHIDDITGRSCKPSDKIIVGGWWYGHTYESRLKEIQNSDMTKEEKETHIKRLKNAKNRKGESVVPNEE